MSAKGDRFFSLAEQKANKFNWFGTMKQQNQEDAADLYIKAAAQYKIAKDFHQAGLSYELAAKCSMAAENEIEAKQNWKESGKCYSHVDIEKSQEAYKNAIVLNLESNRYGQAARLQEAIGDMLADDEKLDDAIAAYEQSADYYNTENDTSNRNKRLLKVAHMCAKQKQWQKAISIYEKTANSCVDSNLLRWKVREYCFKAILLQICMYAEKDQNNEEMSWDKVRSINERYCDISDIYASSRECKYINAVLDALPMEIDDFKDAFVNYDRITKFDSWQTELLLFIQKYMEWKINAPPISLVMGDDETNVDKYEEQPKSNIFAQGKVNNNGGNDMAYDSNNHNTNYDTNEPPDLSGAPDVDLL